MGEADVCAVQCPMRWCHLPQPQFTEGEVGSWGETQVSLVRGLRMGLPLEAWRLAPGSTAGLGLRSLLPCPRLSSARLALSAPPHQPKSSLRKGLLRWPSVQSPLILPPVQKEVTAAYPELPLRVPSP